MQKKTEQNLAEKKLQVVQLSKSTQQGGQAKPCAPTTAVVTPAGQVKGLAHLSWMNYVGFAEKKKKNPFPGGKECFGSGLDSGPIRFECLERLWRLDWGQRGEGSFCPSNQNQRVRPLVLQAQDAPNPLSASQQGQPGTGTQESTSWPAALCLWHKEHTGVGAPQRKPKKSILQAGAAPQDVPQSHTPSQHIMCSCSSCRQLL